MRSGLMILSFILISSCACSQDIRIMFYNSENFFDTLDDPLTEDDEFLPAGVRRWNQSRYRKKLDAIYKTITAAGEWTPPSIVAFCEVENRGVMSDLITKTYLSKFNYSIIHEDSRDRRGIDVCLVYLRDQVKADLHEYWTPAAVGEFTTRSVLYTRFIAGSDTLHLIVNHWPSRRGGILAGEDTRLSIADVVKEKSDSILQHSGGRSRIIITGDFNCTKDDDPIKALTASGLFTCLGESGGGAPGTYRYQGAWESIDHIIVSGQLLSDGHGLKVKPGSFRIFAPDFLLMSDPAYPGKSPFSTYRGFRYQGGFSDHLPVTVDLFRDQQE